MNELTIVKRGNAAYIDSREVAEIIGKRHDNLLRDIDGYLRILEKANVLKVEGIEFFVPSSYIDARGRAKPCYLIDRRGADIIANKLIGEKGVLFTAAYVMKFHEMSEREHEREIAELKSKAATPRLQVFNTAVRNVLAGYSDVRASSEDVMSFLRGAYKPFGIQVIPHNFNPCEWWGTATDIARELNIFSKAGRPHAHAVAAIIEKLPVGTNHFSVMPYGLVGVSLRYDRYVLRKVDDWITARGKPRDIPHNDFEYHVYYEIPRFNRHANGQLSIFDSENDGWFDGDEDDEPDYFSEEELEVMCGDYHDCDDCPGRHDCEDYIFGATD
jgi:Rha family phage regulatory protein